MSYSVKLLRTATLGLLVFLIDPALAEEEGFHGPSFTCEQYTASEASDSSTGTQMKLARLWIHGYLAGLYQAVGMLELSETAEDANALDEAIRSSCREYPEASILAVSQRAVAPEQLEIPAEATTGMSLDRYTCGKHLDAAEEGGTDVDRTELAERWAFAFIQGYKNAEEPEMVIEPKNESLLVDAINRNCADHRDSTYLDVTTTVARAVKLE